MWERCKSLLTFLFEIADRFLTILYNFLPLLMTNLQHFKMLKPFYWSYSMPHEYWLLIFLLAIYILIQLILLHVRILEAILHSSILWSLLMIVEDLTERHLLWEILLAFIELLLNRIVVLLALFRRETDRLLSLFRNSV